MLLHNQNSKQNGKSHNNNSDIIGNDRDQIEPSLLSSSIKYFLMAQLGIHFRRRDKPLSARAMHWLSNRGRHEVKRLYQLMTPRRADDKRLLFIFGCQRSGTTMMTELLGSDWNAEVYAEHSRLSSEDHRERLRLNSLEQVKRALDRGSFPLVVLKPLVESQNCLDLLDYFPNARALWMYRHYQDVASSNLKRFGVDNGIGNLRAVASNYTDDWRSEHVRSDVRSIVNRYFDEAMNPYDAAALFWYVRNRYFFDLGVCTHPRVMLQKYENLIAEPSGELTRLYRFLERPRPGGLEVTKVHDRALGRGSDALLSSAIKDLCERLWRELNGVSAKQRSRDGAPA